MSDSSSDTSRQDVNKAPSYLKPTSGEEIKRFTKVFTVYRQAEFNVDTWVSTGSANKFSFYKGLYTARKGSKTSSFNCLELHTKMYGSAREFL